MTDLRGPIEDLTWGARLPQRVFTAGAAPRLHGFDVHGDLASNYSFAELFFISVVGECPNEAQGRLVEVGLFLLSAMSAREAPAHAALLSRTCGATPTSAISTGVIALGERVRHRLEELAPLLEWLPERSGAPPAAAKAATRAEAESVASALARAGSLSADLELAADAAGLAVLFEAGIQATPSLAGAAMLAAMPAIAAEVAVAKPSELADYPIQAPPFDYDPPGRGE